MVAIIISVPYDAHMSLQLQQIIFRRLAPSIGEKMLVFTLHTVCHYWIFWLHGIQI